MTSSLQIVYEVRQKLKLCKDLLKKLKDEDICSVDRRISEFNEHLLNLQSQLTTNIDPDLMEGKKGDSEYGLPSIDYQFMRQGPTVIVSQQRDIRAEITIEEVKVALIEIDDNKTLRIDGVNAAFSKRLGVLFKRMFAKLYRISFNTTECLRQLTTLVILIPKNAQPDFTRDFRTIACCTTLYKIISRIIKGMLDGIVGKSSQH
ncbi:uncharacterized protein LOC132624613 [Lycium barbarum]|uniref:uncharacterized protein LOC132624613 n=1 Tax=Lycium barbarum TaxID=112863 RepID=UPI00293E58E0|nr:uncharacterized protein LOC132624613 [Lycium barbarum]